MPRSQKPTTSDLFKVCRRYFSEPEARVASELLFWSQFAQHEFRGRVGFYKEDRELGEQLGKHPKSIGRTLRRFSAMPGEDRPDALFIIDHGPKPRARSGRVRWLFRTKRGDGLVSEAEEYSATRLRKKREQVAAIVEHQTGRPIRVNYVDRSPQNVATHIEQINDSDSLAESLSSVRKQREKPDLSKEEKLQEGVTRLERLWAKACIEKGQPTLIWLPSDVRRWSGKLDELMRTLRLNELCDEDLLKRLRLLTGDLAELGCDSVMGPQFMNYNRHGLLIESFAKFGQKLWRVLEAELAEQERFRKQREHALNRLKNAV
jgi:hypothetical protein